ncbi:hypothetical protein EV127DRAFT_515560 [Xylaria flabelliformis]|nr:hypothetical protein EV127DRAFT_515560 [Xylaria flabelliformis]
MGMEEMAVLEPVAKAAPLAVTALAVVVASTPWSTPGHIARYKENRDERQALYRRGGTIRFCATYFEHVQSLSVYRELLVFLMNITGATLFSARLLACSISTS